MVHLVAKCIYCLLLFVSLKNVISFFFFEGTVGVEWKSFFTFESAEKGGICVNNTCHVLYISIVTIETFFLSVNIKVRLQRKSISFYYNIAHFSCFDKKIFCFLHNSLVANFSYSTFWVSKYWKYNKVFYYTIPTRRNRVSGTLFENKTLLSFLNIWDLYSLAWRRSKVNTVSHPWIRGFHKTCQNILALFIRIWSNLKIELVRSFHGRYRISRSAY